MSQIPLYSIACVCNFIHVLLKAYTDSIYSDVLVLSFVLVYLGCVYVRCDWLILGPLSCMTDADQAVVLPKGDNTARIFGGPKGLLSRLMYVCGLTAQLFY